jgi:hypothetical protein
LAATTNSDIAVQLHHCIAEWIAAQWPRSQCHLSSLHGVLLATIAHDQNAPKEYALPSAIDPTKLALGIERMGLVALRLPLVVVTIFAVTLIAAAAGIQRLKIDDSLNQLFRSDTPQFRQFAMVTRRFPSSEDDVLVVLEGKTLLDRKSIAKMRDFVTDLQLLDGVRGVISLFSAREPPARNAAPQPLFPEKLPHGQQYEELKQRVLQNEIIRGKLLSPDGQLALVLVALQPKVVEGSKLDDALGQIRKTVDSDLADTGLKGELSGIPVMQHEIRKAVERDRLIYNAFGFSAGCLIAFAFFRRISFMIVAAAPPLIAILLTLGALGWFHFRLNMFLNVMTPLIMVISFSDSMQLTFAARDRLLAGEPKRSAFANSILIVGPACVLTHATAAISFIALQFSGSDLIRTFGEAGFMATLIALVAVLTLVPTLGLLLIQKEEELAAVTRYQDTGVNVLRSFCGWVAARMVRRPGLYSLVSLLLVAGLGAIYAGLQPRYRLADQVPDGGRALAAIHDIDTKLTGANPIDVLVELPSNRSLYDAETLATIADVHAVVERQAGVGNVWSLETLRRWLAERTGNSSIATLKQYVHLLPQYLKRRFISEDRRAVIVAGRIPDKDASQLLPVIHQLDGALVAVRSRHPDYKIAVTGLSVIAARNSAAMIGKLSQGLTVEIVFVAAFLGLAFRSFVVALVSILPGVFPILLSGAVLWLTGQGLQFASVVALTVSFGLGLSATIHFLNRMRRESDPHADPAATVERATVLVGPALILTTVVLTCGLVVMVLSDLPSLRLFGWLSALAMMSALGADLMILRPTTTFLARLTHKGLDDRTMTGQAISSRRQATPANARRKSRANS